MSLVIQNGGLIKKHGALGRADNAFNVCCCGGCPTCPDLCGYYIEAKAGGAAYYPLKEGSDERVTSNNTFCAGGAHFYYPRPGRPQFVVVTETEGTPGLPSACGLGTSDVEYTGSGKTTGILMTAVITARLAVGDGVEDEPRAQASLGLSCSNGVWTATVNWQVNRFIGGSLVECSARKIFPIRTGCQEDATCEDPPGEGANIHSKVFTVTGNGVTVSGIGTIPFDDDDREGDCSGNACLSAWRSLWQASFEVHRVPCACLGSCDAQNPCPEGCCCIDGQCVAPEEGQCCGPCDEANPCPEGCECVNGECVSPCCINGAIDSSYSSQESCEDCTTTNTCSEYMYLEDPEASCPEGWTSDGWGGCSRTTNPASCESCGGYCYSEQSGPCGVWLTGDILERTNPCAPCDNSCIGVCELPPQELYYEDVNTLNTDAKTGERTIWNSTLSPSTAPWQFRPGYPAAACAYYQLNDGVAYSTWVNGIGYSYSEAQVRLLAIDCEQGDLVDVTGKHTFGGAIKSYGCVVNNFVAPVAECLAALQVPALKPQPIPQLICPP